MSIKKTRTGPRYKMTGTPDEIKKRRQHREAMKRYRAKTKGNEKSKAQSKLHYRNNRSYHKRRARFNYIRRKMKPKIAKIYKLD
jgi:hypothetical protein